MLPSYGSESACDFVPRPVQEGRRQDQTDSLPIFRNHKNFPLPSMQKGKVYTEGTPAFLPSSLTNIGPDALGFSPHPPVSVYGTIATTPDYDAFLGTWLHANSPCGVSPCSRVYNLKPNLLRGIGSRHRSSGFAWNSTLQTKRRTYSQNAHTSLMRPALDNVVVVTEYQPYFPSGVPLGAHS